ncbi:MAG: LptF/LptG family permease [Phycisphaerae bacterium]|jgi:lipopolysaccharide export LptBFGC system permease protein LptF|nr:LptF/LptG family permease [Phycisphaerae bacterium]
MLKTLHWYISRELIRITLMALAVFTLLFTVIMIMEPMRKKGLATGQVAQLFVYTLPAMVTFTLPFAALFAVTFTYGRFAQDRELLACRASGIATAAILRPGLFLGIAITVISLVLTNFVAPASARAGEAATLSNFKAIAYHMIRKESHAKFGDYIVHATHVDPDKDALIGVVAGEMDTEVGPDGKTIRVMQAMVASQAFLQIDEVTDPNDPDRTDYYASVDLRDPVGPLTNQPGLQVVHSQAQPSGWKIDDPSQERPLFYDWDRLLEVYRNPGRHSEIRDRMGKVKRLIRYDRVLDDMETVLRAGRPQTVLRVDDRQFEILAPRIRRRGPQMLRLTARRDGDGQLQPVRVRVYRGRDVQQATADSGVITCDYSPLSRESHINITLSGNVRVPAEPGVEAPRLETWQRGQIPLPPDPELLATSPAEIYQDPEAYTDDETIIADVRGLRARALKWKGEAYAEMHTRIAFGLQGVLLVTLGAALGVVLRSGQAITALVVAMGPALVGFISIKMGQRVLSNPESSDIVGLSVVWGSLVVLLAANGFIYWRLRKV